MDALKYYMRIPGIKLLAFLPAIMILSGSTTVFGTITPVPNFQYLQFFNDQNGLNSNIRQYLRGILNVQITCSRLNQSCELTPLRIHITQNHNNINIRGIKVFIRTAAQRNLSGTTGNGGNFSFTDLAITDYPLTVNIPLIEYNVQVKNPVTSLHSPLEIRTYLNNCAQINEHIHQAIFFRLLSVTKNRPVYEKAGIIEAYCHDLSLSEICNNVRGYFSGNTISEHIKQRLGQTCHGVGHCLP